MSTKKASVGGIVALTIAYITTLLGFILLNIYAVEVGEMVGFLKIVAGVANQLVFMGLISSITEGTINGWED